MSTQEYGSRFTRVGSGPIQLQGGTAHGHRHTRVHISGLGVGYNQECGKLSMVLLRALERAHCWAVGGPLVLLREQPVHKAIEWLLLCVFSRVNHFNNTYELIQILREG